MATDKSPAPAYGSFKSLVTFFNARREDGHITTFVDRSLLSNFNGSTANELLASLKFLKLIDDKGKPSTAYEQFVTGGDDERKVQLGQLLRDAYPFVFSNPDFNLERETTGRITELFRQQGVNGSTLTRAIAFFLAAAKEAGIKVSPNIKAPPVTRNPKPKRATTSNTTTEPVDDDGGDEDDVDPPGFQSFDIPIPINRKVKILIPAEWSPEDWDLFQSMLKVYIDGWKQQTQKAKERTQSEAT